ncbi:hypothetical protein ACFY05_32755 [Microtetraspora fusca]|uniref:Uncharacterized protein n=1 Tax=Microtetraspora fusca TaxID=1997 RepID=A0ABW6VE41_MICFU
MIAAALAAETQAECAECGGALVRTFSMYLGWYYVSLTAQGDVPAAQCPKVPGLGGFGHGPHRPAVYAEA